MSTPILATKLYLPPPRPNLVVRARLNARLNAGLHGKLTLISAPAGFGKTTLVSAWLTDCQSPVAWLSLDAEDNDQTRFLTYLVAALQQVAPAIGSGVLRSLQSPQPPPITAILTTLLNEISMLPDNPSTGAGQGFILVLDDYHLIEADSPVRAIDQALIFLLDHLPSQMHLVIATREDPNLPLPKLRARGQLSEVRATDLRFTPTEAAEFLNQVMGLTLSAAEISALETRTEGWIAGLQLAALSMQGQQDTPRFIEAFTGSHRFVMDYLVEEVLHQQPAAIQRFLLHTSILDRLCGPLCDALLHDSPLRLPLDHGTHSGQTTLEYLEQANLFIVPLDNERRWYRYHHLFAELLRQRLRQSQPALLTSAMGETAGGFVAELHIRASQWYEENDLPIEAFYHAATANDVERAERLIEGKGIPLHLRGAVMTILNWLASLPTAVLNARPWLWWHYGSLLLVSGHTTGVEEKLQAAEDALHSTEMDERLGDKTRNFVGRIATARAVLALTQYKVETMLVQSRRALAYLDADNLSARANANWVLGYAYVLQGDRGAAQRAYREAIALGQASADLFATILATTGLGQVQVVENQLHQARQTFQHLLQLAGDQPLQIIYDVHLGLAHVCYEWNDLAGAEQHGQQSLHLAQQYDQVIDRFIVCELFLVRLKLAQGDVEGAAALVVQAAQSARQRNFVQRIPEVAAAQVMVLLRQGKLTAAAQIAQTHELPLCQARVRLAEGNPSAALALLNPLQQEMAAKAWADETLKVLVLQAIAYYALGEEEEALERLRDALALAEPDGFIRTFVDEGLPMMALLHVATIRGMMPDYTSKLLAAFNAEGEHPEEAHPPLTQSPHSVIEPLLEPLSEREREVLHLIAAGKKNQEIADELIISLNTVRYHTKNLFGKLGVNKRIQAVAKAQELQLI